MFKNFKFSLLILACLCFIPWNKATADTNVSSSSITNPVWTPENSPYIVSGTLEVATGATLKIQAGTEVRFNPGAKLLVNGELDVLGTAADPVMLTLNTASSSASSTSGFWGGIEFGTNAVSANFSNGVYTNGSIIRNAIIKFSAGVKCYDASPYIVDNQFNNNTVGLNILGTAGSAGGLVLDAANAGSNSSKIKPLYISDNTFSDNGVGIVINRNNGQDYVMTPAGYSYIGDSVVTAYIDKNTISGSSLGIQIAAGDNDVITNNIIRYNSGPAIFLADTTRGHVIQNNELNNNTIGLTVTSANTAILQNNIKNNADTGLQISQRPLLLTANNIYNNKKYNLNNLVYSLPAINNYWGSSVAGTIEKSFLTAVTTITASGTASSTMNYPVKYDPFLKQEAYLSSLIEPIVDALATSTTASSVYLSGLKAAGTDVYVNDKIIKAGLDSISWTYQIDLDLGSNDFTVYYKNKNGDASVKKTFNIIRLKTLSDPTLISYDKATTAESTVVKGTKPAGSSIRANGKEIVPADSNTDWSYNFALNLGANSWTLTANWDNTGQISAPVALTITRNPNVTADIIAAEKKASLTPDSKLAAKLAGRLLLQVENKGNIWYVNPGDNKRYLVTTDNALALFRKFSVGISEANLNKIPTKESGQKGDAGLRKRLSGKFLLRVEKSGNISYVDINGYRNDINRENLMTIFRGLSLGVANANIYKIPVGEIALK